MGTYSGITCPDGTVITDVVITDVVVADVVITDVVIADIAGRRHVQRHHVPGRVLQAVAGGGGPRLRDAGAGVPTEVKQWLNGG